MAAEVTVKFTPDGRSDFSGAVTLVTQAGRFAVPLRAARPRPALALPRVVDVGNVLLGTTRQLQVGARQSQRQRQRPKQGQRWRRPVPRHGRAAARLARRRKACVAQLPLGTPQRLRAPLRRACGVRRLAPRGEPCSA